MYQKSTKINQPIHVIHIYIYVYILENMEIWKYMEHVQKYETMESMGKYGNTEI